MIRVLLVDDQALLRSGLRALLDAEADITVVGEAADGAQAQRLVTELEPDVVLMDIRMPGVDGLTATKAITGEPRLANVHIVILTTFELDEYIFRSPAIRREWLPRQGHRARRAGQGGPHRGGRRLTPVAGCHPKPHRGVRHPIEAPRPLTRPRRAHQPRTGSDGARGRRTDQRRDRRTTRD